MLALLENQIRTDGQLCIGRLSTDIWIQLDFWKGWIIDSFCNAIQWVENRYIMPPNGIEVKLEHSWRDVPFENFVYVALHILFGISARSISYKTASGSIRICVLSYPNSEAHCNSVAKMSAFKLTFRPKISICERSGEPIRA